MKLKDGLTLQNMGDEFVVAAQDPALFRGMIKLNDSGAFLFKLMQKECNFDELLAEITREYDTDQDRAYKDLERFIKVFERFDLIE